MTSLLLYFNQVSPTTISGTTYSYVIHYSTDFEASMYDVEVVSGNEYIDRFTINKSAKTITIYPKRFAAESAEDLTYGELREVELMLIDQSRSYSDNFKLFIRKDIQSIYFQESTITVPWGVTHVKNSIVKTLDNVVINPDETYYKNGGYSGFAYGAVDTVNDGKVIEGNKYSTPYCIPVTPNADNYIYFNYFYNFISVTMYFFTADKTYINSYTYTISPRTETAKDLYCTISQILNNQLAIRQGARYVKFELNYNQSSIDTYGSLGVWNQINRYDNETLLQSDVNELDEVSVVMMPNLSNDTITNTVYAYDDTNDVYTEFTIIHLPSPTMPQQISTNVTSVQPILSDFISEGTSITLADVTVLLSPDWEYKIITPYVEYSPHITIEETGYGYLITQTSTQNPPTYDTVLTIGARPKGAITEEAYYTNVTDIIIKKDNTYTGVFDKTTLEFNSDGTPITNTIFITNPIAKYLDPIPYEYQIKSVTISNINPGTTGLVASQIVVASDFTGVEVKGNLTENKSTTVHTGVFRITVTWNNNKTAYQNVNVKVLAAAEKPEDVPIWKDVYYKVDSETPYYMIMTGSTPLYIGCTSSLSTQIKINDIVKDYITLNTDIFSSLHSYTNGYIPISLGVAKEANSDASMYTIVKSYNFFYNYSYTENNEIDSYGLLSARRQPIQYLDDRQYFITTRQNTCDTEVVPFRSYVRAYKTDGSYKQIELNPNHGEIQNTTIGNTTGFNQLLLLVQGINERWYYDVLPCTDTNYCLYYINKCGGWNWMLFTGKNIEKDNITRENYLDNEGKTTQYKSEYEKTFTLTSKYLTEVQSKMLADLYESPYIILHKLDAKTELGEKELYNVNITDKTFEYKTFKNNNRKFITHTINITEAKKYEFLK